MAVSKQISESRRYSSNMGWAIVLLLSACQLQIISAYSLRPAPLPADVDVFINEPDRCSPNPCVHGSCKDYPQYGLYICECDDISCIDVHCNCDVGLQPGPGLKLAPEPIPCVEGELVFESGFRCGEGGECLLREALCDQIIHCINSVDEGRICSTLRETANSDSFVRPVNGTTPATPGDTTPVKQVNNKCSENLCGNGKCLEWPSYVHGYLCVCDKGYQGAQCQDFNECSSDPCMNGQCEDGDDAYTCKCGAGWTGTQCDIDIDECSNNPCINGACQDGINQYNCSCDAGWTGNNCDTDIDDCSNKPCTNGVCQDGINQYTCSCDEGWTGNNSDTDIDDCSNNPCNNGVCQDGVDEYTCTCDEGWTGNNCDTDMPGEGEGEGEVTNLCSDRPCSPDQICYHDDLIKACLPKIPFAGFCSCKNGGTCVENPELDSRYCACLGNYYGIFCDEGGP